MMYLWKPEMIRFMRDASEYGSYSSELARLMLPYLTEDSRVCDAGCGLGYLSLELARRVRTVTAVDVNEDALRVLRGNCAQRGIGNVEAVCADVFTLKPKEKFTHMVFCYFGDIDAIAAHAQSLCDGPVFIFNRNYEMHRFSAAESAGSEANSHEAACRRLTELGIPFIAQEMEAEFGQPFRSLAAARRYYALYSSGSDPDAEADPPVIDRLVETGREDFPYYLPYRKKTGCIIIDRQSEGGKA